MTKRFDTGPDDLDRLLSVGAPGAAGDDDLARFVADLRASHLCHPDAAVEAKHVAALVAAAQAGAGAPGVERPRTTKRRTPMFGNRLAASTARLLAIVTASFLALAGLAIAGVTLPEPARGVADSLGLPNQDDKADSSPASRVLGEDPPPSEPGCEFGQAVAERASDGKVAAEDPCDKKDADDKRNKDRSTDDPSKQRSDQGEERSRFGQETAARARRQREATVEQRRQFGQETAARARSRSNGQSQGSAGNATPPSGGGVQRPSTVTPSGPPADVPQGPPAGRPPGRP